MADERTPVVTAADFGVLLEYRWRKSGHTLERVAKDAGVSKQLVWALMHPKQDSQTGLDKALRVAAAVGLRLHSRRSLPTEAELSAARTRGVGRAKNPRAFARQVRRSADHKLRDKK